MTLGWAEKNSFGVGWPSAGQKRTLLGLEALLLGRTELFWGWKRCFWAKLNAFGAGSAASGQNWMLLGLETGFLGRTECFWGWKLGFWAELNSFGAGNWVSGQNWTLLGLETGFLGRTECFWGWKLGFWAELNSFGAGNWVSGQSWTPPLGMVFPDIVQGYLKGLVSLFHTQLSTKSIQEIKSLSMICKKKLISLIGEKVWLPSDLSTQNWSDRSDFVRPINELAVIVKTTVQALNDRQKN